MPGKSPNSKYSVYRICPECLVTFKLKRKNNRTNPYCDLHRHLYIHANTGKKPSKEIRLKLSRIRKSLFESGKLSHKEENHPRWKGGRRLKNGRVMIRMPDHPHCDQKGYVHEYRLRGEKALGRTLKTDEIVHHFNDSNDTLLLCKQGYHIALHNKLRKQQRG